MESLVTCPQCNTQLAVPAGTAPHDRAQCPECDATFLLENAVQATPPVARILDAVEAASHSTRASLESELESVEVESSRSTSDTPATAPESAPLASWESRLKNAIQRDMDELSEPGSNEETGVSNRNQAVSSPDFEFHLDPPLEKDSSYAERLSTEKTYNGNPEVINDESFDPELESVSVASAPTEQPTNVTGNVEAETDWKARPRRRSRGFSPLKLCALVIGPGVTGTLLGLYGLLWIKGPSADYLNLAQHLPQTMLPEALGKTDSNLLPAPNALAEKVEPDSEPAQLAEVDGPPNLQLRETELPVALHDEAVQVAVAEQPVSPEPANTYLLPEGFEETLGAASDAMPDLTGGNLSSNEAVSRMGRAYMTFCRLAELLTSIPQQELDQQSQEKVASALQLFSATTADSTASVDVATITSRWWGYAKRPNQGIFIAGQISDMQSVGDRVLCYVSLDQPASATVIPVLLDEQPGLVGERIVVVGEIVLEPYKNLQDFALNMPAVVVSQYSGPL